jgi:hypothetical protein
MPLREHQEERDLASELDCRRVPEEGDSARTEFY